MTTNSYNGRLINVIPSILIDDQPREVRLQKDAQFNKYLKLHSEKKKLEEKLDTYPLKVCILICDSILNGVIESN